MKTDVDVRHGSAAAKQKGAAMHHLGISGDGNVQQERHWHTRHVYTVNSCTLSSSGYIIIIEYETVLFAALLGRKSQAVLSNYPEHRP